MVIATTSEALVLWCRPIPADTKILFIPEGQNNGAMGGDIVRAKITNKSHRDGKAMYHRSHYRNRRAGRQKTVCWFAGKNLAVNGWYLPDGNMLTEAILTPDAASRHIKVGTKVVVELTTYPGENGGDKPKGVITEVLGAAGEKDVDLKAVIVQFNLPGPFPR